MNDQPLVSVLIPCYNVSDFVEQAISSILKQTYYNLEVLIIDDASTDDTLAKIKLFDDHRIRVITHQVNTKKIGAVNDALNQARGELICFQDADDWSDQRRVESQVKAFKDNDHLGICFTGYSFNQQKTESLKLLSMTDEELKDEFLNFGNRKYVHLSPTICATMMITSGVLSATGGYHPYFQGRVAEDIHWIYRILKKYKGLSILDELYSIRKREDSLTGMQVSGKNAKAAYSWKLLSKIIYQDIHHNKDVFDSSNSSILQALELDACEEALTESIQDLYRIRKSFEQSSSYRLGRFLLFPFKLLQKKLSFLRS